MEAVNDRLPQDAAALYLSGGLDSATVCAVAGRIASSRGQKEKLKSFGFGMRCAARFAFCESTARISHLTMRS
jgi:asparagine synthetase B (glutamine-hydrolysing)